MKVLITGSHFTPAQAVIEQLQQKNIEIVYVGRNATREGDKTPSVESQILPKMGIKFIHLTTGRLQRTFTRHTIPSLLKVPVGLIQAFWIILNEKPSVILSFGGYTAVPLVFAGWLFSIPVIIHEQTLVSGLANTISSWFASKIAVSFQDHDYPFPKEKIVVTGNPMRKEILHPFSRASKEIEELISLAKKEKLPVILITGGNQGSHIINNTIERSLADLLNFSCIIHQTGDSGLQDFESLSKKRDSLKHPQRYLPKKWIEGKDMGVVFRRVDIAVSRAGINTLLELAFVGLPSLVIPIPHMFNDEQLKNAQFFSKIGLVKFIHQDKLNKDVLIQTLKEMVENLEQLKNQAKSCKKVVVLDSSQKLALETIILGNQKI